MQSNAVIQHFIVIILINALIRTNVNALIQNENKTNAPDTKSDLKYASNHFVSTNQSYNSHQSTNYTHTIKPNVIKWTIQKRSSQSNHVQQTMHMSSNVKLTGANQWSAKPLPDANSRIASYQEEMAAQMQRVRQLTLDQMNLKKQMEDLEVQLRSMIKQNRPTEAIEQELAQSQLRWKTQQMELQKLYRVQLEYQRQQLEQEERMYVGDLERLRQLAERRKHWELLWKQFQQRQMKESHSAFNRDFRFKNQQTQINANNPSSGISATVISNNNGATKPQGSRPVVRPQERPRPDVSNQWYREENQSFRNQPPAINKAAVDSVPEAMTMTGPAMGASNSIRPSEPAHYYSEDCEERDQREEFLAKEDQRQINEQIRLYQAHQNLLKMQQKRQYEEIRRLMDARLHSMPKVNDCNHNHECDCSDNSTMASSTTTSASAVTSSNPKSVYGAPYQENLEPQQ